MSKDALIKVRNLTIIFGKLLVLNNVNLDIKQGEIFGIVGLSGSGKTTFLNILGGVIDPTVGKIEYRFLEKTRKKSKDKKSKYNYVQSNQLKVRQIFGFTAQDPSFYLKLTVDENLRYFSSMYGIKKELREKNMAKVLELVGLDHCKNSLAGQLSGGMMKRLDIACALVHNPDVLILDEPTSDLDPLLRAQMIELIKRINSQGTTIIIASHFLKDMEKLCTRIGVLHKKQLGTVGTPDHIKNLYTKNEEIHLETYPGKYDKILKKLKKSKKSKVSEIINKGHKLILYSPDSIKVLHDILHILEKQKEHIIDIEVAKPSLKEVFESLVKGKNEQTD
ncbi:MAG: Trehalose/maltose import ATP-binding protein MalK [Candidatus Woesearchaeota archaeon]|nr:Trehalose/maltose import ATP-binding protein MalK [Candidatus Woesearchaeota archaeon]